MAPCIDPYLAINTQEAITDVIETRALNCPRSNCVVCFASQRDEGCVHLGTNGHLMFREPFLMHRKVRLPEEEDLESVIIGKGVHQFVVGQVDIGYSLSQIIEPCIRHRRTRNHSA